MSIKNLFIFILLLLFSQYLSNKTSLNKTESIDLNHSKVSNKTTKEIEKDDEEDIPEKKRKKMMIMIKRRKMSFIKR